MTHYDERLERDLAKIRRRVDSVGQVLDEAIADAKQAFLDRDHALASATILGDFAVNRATREIDKLCHRFVALYVPSAGVLRFISAVLRTSTALERIGDYAVSIAQEAVQLERNVPSGVASDISLMADEGRTMLRQSLRAFQDLNADFARGTMAMEYQADGVYRRVFRDLLEEGERSDLPVRDLLALHVTVYRLERITDQAKNICEETVFAATGEIKENKTCGILFLDDRRAGPSIMAHAIARKGFPDCGGYDSAGWAPVESLDPDFVEFMDRHGHDIRDLVPKQVRTGPESLRRYQVIVALSPGAEEQIPTIPYSTVLLDWSDEIAAVGPKGSYEDEHREALYRLLVPKIDELIDILRGERTD